MDDADVSARALAEKWGSVRGQHIEMMAAAYALKTGLGPDEVVLIEQRSSDGKTIRWWFEKK